jgi:hypothetical protein
LLSEKIKKELMKIVRDMIVRKIHIHPTIIGHGLDTVDSSNSR